MASQITRVAISEVMLLMSYGERDLHHFEAANRNGAHDQLQQFQGLAGQKTPGFRPAGAWNEAGIDAIDVERRRTRSRFHRWLGRKYSVTVSTLVLRSRQTFTPLRGTCQPPNSQCTRLLAGALAMFVAWNHGQVWIRSFRAIPWVSTWRSK